MTEDHRVTSTTERARFAKLGKPLKESETRLCGNSVILLCNAPVAKIPCSMVSGRKLLKGQLIYMNFIFNYFLFLQD